jgi:hypothetical protein
MTDLRTLANVSGVLAATWQSRFSAACPVRGVFASISIRLRPTAQIDKGSDAAAGAFGLPLPAKLATSGDWRPSVALLVPGEARRRGGAVSRASDNDW